MRHMMVFYAPDHGKAVLVITVATVRSKAVFYIEDTFNSLTDHSPLQ